MSSTEYAELKEWTKELCKSNQALVNKIQSPENLLMECATSPYMGSSKLVPRDENGTEMCLYVIFAFFIL